MMLTYFMGKGGIGCVIDGCVRDWPHVQHLDLGLWMRGVTPNHGWQNNIMPFAVNQPISCAGVLVMPGDIIVADDDGAIVVPVQMAAELIQNASKKNEWEDFTRMKLAQGGDLRKYYPLSDEARKEYETWDAERKKVK
jgi:regulator of RNase E activity RraA